MTFDYVDSHCHLDQYSQPDVVAREAVQARVEAVAVTELPSAYRRFRAHLGQPRGVHLALGFHPLALPRSSMRERALFVQHLPSCKFIGEVGLDYRAASDRSTQRETFDWILDQNGIDQKILSVHSRGADKDVIAALAGSGVRAILHWYTGPSALVERALQAGLYFSVNSSMLRTKKGRALIEAIPRDRLLTETDGPYGKVGRLPASPAAIPETVDSLASTWGVPHGRARSVIWENWTTLGKPADSAPTLDRLI